MGWCYGLTDLEGTPLGRLHWAKERKLTLPLNGLPVASFRLALDDTLAGEVLDRAGDVLLKVYTDASPTPVFVGECTLVEEIGAGGFYKRVIDRGGLVNQAYSLPETFPPDDTTVEADVRLKLDTTSRDARGLFEEVITSDVKDSQLRQALVESHVAVRKVPRQIITFDPSATGDAEGSVSCNFAGPFWRLQKRMMGKSTLGLGAAYDDPADDILKAFINDANAEHDTGIQIGTVAALYEMQAGTWYFKLIAEAIAELQAGKVPYPVGNPPAFVARDTFSQAAGGPLTGQADDLTNVWGSAGSTDFQVETAGHTAGRSAVSDANYRSGRWAISGVANQTEVVVGIDYKSSVDYASGNNLYPSVIARYQDTSNWLMCFIDLQSNQFCLDMMHDLLTPTNPLRLGTFTFSPGGPAANTWYSIRLFVDALGNYTCWHYATADGLGPVMIQGQHASLATGGARATGKVGFTDALSTAGAVTRIYDNWGASAFTGPQSFDFEFAPIEPTGGPPPKIATFNAALQIGTTKPAAVFEPGRTPTFPADYIVGDFVTGRAKRFNAEFRIFQFDLSIDEEGKEAVVPMLVPNE